VQREGRPYRVSRFHWMHGQARAAGFVSLDLVDLATGARTSEKLRLEDQAGSPACSCLDGNPAASRTGSEQGQGLGWAGGRGR
jgi:hypothetical protein